MKRTAVIWMPVLFLLFILTLEDARARSDVFAQQPFSNAVILFCGQEIGIGKVKVEASSSSSGSPAIDKGTSCADALATLGKKGFRLIAAEAKKFGVVYTLVSPE